MRTGTKQYSDNNKKKHTAIVVVKEQNSKERKREGEKTIATVEAFLPSRSAVKFI